MTREEAISIMSVIVHMLEPQYDTDRIEDAVEMAIEALKQEPITVETINQYCKEHNYVLCEKGTESKTGRWIAQDIHNCHTDFKCSECGYIHNFMHLYGEPTADYTYCPNCGARMKEGDA